MPILSSTASVSSFRLSQTVFLQSIKHCTENKSSRDAYLHQGESRLDPDSGPGLLPKFTGDFLVQGYICDKIFTKIQSISSEILANLWKNALSCNVEESFKKFLDPDPGIDDFQNLTSYSLCTDISVTKFS